MKRLVIFLLVLAFLTGCGAQPQEALALETETPEFPTVRTITPQAIPTPPVPTPSTPVSYQEFQIEGGAKMSVWDLKGQEVSLAGVAPVALVLAAADSPLPIGDILAVTLIAGTAHYLIVAQPDTAVVPGSYLPRIPEIDWGGIKHAAEGRGWPLMFTMIVYAAVSNNPDGVYYGPVSGRLVVSKNLGSSVFALVFAAETAITPLLPDGTLGIIPVGRGLMTIVINPDLNRLRSSDCASWQLVPVIGYSQVYEPPPTGIGRCLTNGNTN